MHDRSQEVTVTTSKERELRRGPLQPRTEARAQPISPITSFEAQFVSMVEDLDDNSVLGVILFMGKVAGASPPGSSKQ